MGLSTDPEVRGPICEDSGKERLTKGGAKSLAKRRTTRTYNLHAYKCPSCRGWHVGNIRRF